MYSVWRSVILYFYTLQQQQLVPKENIKKYCVVFKISKNVSTQLFYLFMFCPLNLKIYEWKRWICQHLYHRVVHGTTYSNKFLEKVQNEIFSRCWQEHIIFICSSGIRQLPKKFRFCQQTYHILREENHLFIYIFSKNKIQSSSNTKLFFLFINLINPFV